MGIAQKAVRSLHNFWNHGEEEEFDREEAEDTDHYGPPRTEREDRMEPPRYDAAPPSRTGGGSGGSGPRRSSAVPLRMPPSREKQIYTIKPHGLEEASAAADFLKLGSAVVVSLDDVDRTTAVRIIDFMSGVCYGLDAQGHAMKLGDTIFLFTPGEFEITSDEPDYNENPEFFFRDVPTSALDAAKAAAAAQAAAQAEREEQASQDAGADKAATTPRPW